MTRKMMSTSSTDPSSSSFITAVITKSNPSEPLGIGLMYDINLKGTIITRIKKDSLVYHSDLQVGMIFISINNINCWSMDAAEVANLLGIMTGTFTILAQKVVEPLRGPDQSQSSRTTTSSDGLLPSLPSNDNRNENDERTTTTKSSSRRSNAAAITATAVVEGLLEGFFLGAF